MKNLLVILYMMTHVVFAHAKTFNVMGPLAIGNPNDLSSAQSQEAFRKFEVELERVKHLGADAVSTDVWWGIVEKSDQQFDWQYYQRVANLIEAKGLKWMPILSFHQCGGNVGDDCDIRLPSWIWKKYGDEIAYKSEQGNISRETISVWATAKVQNEYRDFMLSFREAFKNKANVIEEINVSLGPAGELRYPSYNSHDKNAGYPTRGALQASSSLAQQSFRHYTEKKYQTLENLKKAWGFQLNSFQEVSTPNPTTFFANNESWSNYGKDFYDWYSASLRMHGKILLTTAIQVYAQTFPRAAIGFKVPGVHWRAAPGGDRLAELAAGLITTSDDLNSDHTGHGYHHLISMASEIKKLNNFDKLNLHFTCLEMDNGEGGDSVKSYSKALVFWVGQEARKQNLTIYGENALSGNLGSPRAWENIRDALKHGGYSGVTILRMGNIIHDQTAQDQFSNMAKEHN